jgi:hypothetical protein
MSPLRSVLVTAFLVVCINGCTSTVSAPPEQRPEAESLPNASSSTPTESPSELIASFRKTTPATRDAWLRDHAAALNALDSEGAAEVKNAVIEIVTLERAGNVDTKALGAQTDALGAQTDGQTVAFGGSCSRVVCGGGVLGDLKCLGNGCFRGCSFASAVCYDN